AHVELMLLWGANGHRGRSLDPYLVISFRPCEGLPYGLGGGVQLFLSFHSKDQNALRNTTALLLWSRRHPPSRSDATGSPVPPRMPSRQCARRRSRPSRSTWTPPRIRSCAPRSIATSCRSQPRSASRR